ncbi:MAG: LLM class flavin-dependent oxidoreductase [Chloroflexi bacterium]|nr:LLM class flavin-dependent oxidoreductase [Chloroflexota bacterium]
MPDHLVVPVRYAPGQYPYAGGREAPIAPTSPFVDPLLTLAYIAATTSRIHLGTSVFTLPLRDPIATARAVLTLDHLSGGRALFGVGAGWLREEFEVAGQQ